jgi:hypothetical protein
MQVVCHRVIHGILNGFIMPKPVSHRPSKTQLTVYVLVVSALGVINIIMTPESPWFVWVAAGWACQWARESSSPASIYPEGHSAVRSIS